LVTAQIHAHEVFGMRIVFWYTAAMKKIKPLYIVIGALVLSGGLFVWYKSTPGMYDTFAQCIGERGATFYGAFWCPHCQEQKRVFGKSAKLLPYVECSTPDGQRQLDVCKDAGITSYPTWILADGTKETGVFSIQALADKTGCEIPA
jgi:thiol-disulfide isomerase/thioredoxin